MLSSTANGSPHILLTQLSSVLCKQSALYCSGKVDCVVRWDWVRFQVSPSLLKLNHSQSCLATCPPSLQPQGRMAEWVAGRLAGWLG